MGKRELRIGSSTLTLPPCTTHLPERNDHSLHSPSYHMLTRGNARRPLEVPDRNCPMNSVLPELMRSDHWVGVQHLQP